MHTFFIISLMHQVSSKVSRPSRRAPKIDRLEAEYQKNQERIRQLHRRNRDLAEQMRNFQAIGQESRGIPARLIAQRSPLSARRPKSWVQAAILSIISIVDGLQHFDRLRIGKQPLVFWLKAAMMMLIVAVVCGTLGFMLTRLIGLLIGG
jgi:nitrate/nitrite-specific signal transduction histidine kinase